MTESLKLAELHRTNIEYERQRHLANWLINSGPHMAKPSTTPHQQQQSAANQKHNKNGTMTQNPLFFLTKSSANNLGPSISCGTTVSGGGGGMSRSTLFNSQTNLPLQIMTSQDGHKPKLRRFNSHDTSANMFSVADFENARLARRNELEMKQRQQNRYKMNSLSSGGDCSTGDSKGSKFSNDSHAELLQAELFLDRFSLPRVVRVTTAIKLNCNNETLQSSSSNGSSSSTAVVNLINKKESLAVKPNGELYLLYRHIKNRKSYHGFNGKNGASKKKGVIIPQEFQGFFSLTNESGASTATMYTTLVQLVRERVYKFLSVDNLAAYTESQNTDTFPPRPHYVKGTARGGQIFRLLAVFEDGKHDSANSNSTNSTKSNNNAFREKEKGRYAQLLNENRQVVYVSLTSKGKFYEIEQSTPQIFQKTTSTPDAITSVATLNPDCVHRISPIINNRTADLPITVRFISGPQGTVNIIPDVLTVHKVTTETIIVACPIEDAKTPLPLQLRKLCVTPEMEIIKCFLGFENEQKMFLNQNIQNILKFCQINIDNFLRLVEYEHLISSSTMSTKSKTDSALKILKPLNFPRLLRRERSNVAHEKEESIIFLSKNDLENMDNSNRKAAPEPSEKLKVFQSTKKNWFRNLKSSTGRKSNSFTSLDGDVHTKRMSMDRYQDMSKLLQERFGDNNDPIMVNSDHQPNERGRSSSEIGIDPRQTIQHAEDLRQKSMSLQDMDMRSEFANKPDLVRVEFHNGGSTSNVVAEVNHDAEHDDIVVNQQSFISEKLYNEFHVKTKQHSKSSSHLHNLLHFAVPQKMNVNETRKKLLDNTARPEEVIVTNNHVGFTSVHSSVPANMSYEDDLPYSSVRDSLVIDEHEMFPKQPDSITHRDSAFYGGHDGQMNHENIYAEICSDATNNRHSSTTSHSDHNNSGRNSPIRITVMSNPSFSGSTNSGVPRLPFPVTDNIYNTLN